MLKSSDGYGGSNEVSSSGQGQRALSMGDRIACQVVQQLPNGNLSVQGKKTLVNGNERVDFIVTGVVDPRWLSVDGEVYSYNVSMGNFETTDYSIDTMYQIFNLLSPAEVQYQEAKTKVYSTDLSNICSSNEQYGYKIS